MAEAKPNINGYLSDIAFWWIMTYFARRKLCSMGRKRKLPPMVAARMNCNGKRKY